MQQLSNTETQYFIKAIRQLISESDAAKLVKTLAIVKAVKDEGYLIDVDLVDKEASRETLEGVPVLHNQYFNTPIYENDLVILQTLDRSFDSYIVKGEFNESLKIQTYFAVPYTLFENFKHKNEFSIITKNDKFKLRLNEDDGLSIENQLDCIEQHKTVEIASQQTMKLSSQADTVIESQTTMEVKTAAMSLGSAFEQLIDIFTNVASMTTPNGGPVAEWPAIVAQLTALKPLIKQNFK